MKKLLSLIIVIGLIAYFSNSQYIVLGNSNANVLSKKLIRFHVIANSDSVEDQTLKMKIKDAVIQYMKPILNNVDDIETARKVLASSEAEVQKIALDIVHREGYDYSVEVGLQKENFPIKSYGNIVLPAGSYESFQIKLGENKGQNWWCVMFPPLCFVDITRAEVNSRETIEVMKKTLSDEEIKQIENNIEQNADEQSQGIVLKSKFAEVLKQVFKSE